MVRRFAIGGRAHGFTLIEMLVVLAVMTLVAAVIPRLIGRLPAFELRTARGHMVAQLRELHGEAIRRGRVTELALDPAAFTYALSTAPTRYRLPDVIDRIDFQETRLLRPSLPIRIRFFPDGSATGGRLTLGHGDRAVAITIDWQTGRIAGSG